VFCFEPLQRPLHGAQPVLVHHRTALAGDGADDPEHDRFTTIRPERFLAEVAEPRNSERSDVVKEAKGLRHDLFVVAVERLDVAVGLAQLRSDEGLEIGDLADAGCQPLSHYTLSCSLIESV
jgi:hypothetical protein